MGDLQDMWGGVWKEGEGELFISLTLDSHFLLPTQWYSDAMDQWTSGAVDHPTVTPLIVIENVEY